MKTIILNNSGVKTILGSLVLVTGLIVRADTAVYLNDSNDAGQSLNFANGWTIGNEILLAGSTTISSFDFEYYSPVNYFTGSVNMTVNLYANEGTLVSGYPAPSRSLFSDTFALLPPSNPLGTGGYASILIETPNVLVPSDFTLAVTITGLSGDTLGLELYNNRAPGSPGLAYNDYWFDNGSGYQLLQTPAGGPNNFGARFFTADVPEPSSICLALMGGLVFGLNFRRRQSA